MKDNLVIGLGEVGSAIQKILECDGYDPGIAGLPGVRYEYDVLHICFPYSNGFVDSVIGYRELFNASLVVVHSTVPVGTCRLIKAVHSPIRGVHPHLEKGIRTFVKFFGGQEANRAAKIFKSKGVHTHCVFNSDDTEALKLWDTTQYGTMILLNKEIKEFCEKNKLDFDTVYTLANKTYNEGYRKLGRDEVVRPYLRAHAWTDRGSLCAC